MTTKIAAPKTIETKTTDVDTVTFQPKVKDKRYTVAVPTGFDFNQNKPMKKRQFASDAIYYEHRAAQMDHKATAFRAKADECKKLGSHADQVKTRKLEKLNVKMLELRKELEAQGVDVEELLKKAATVEAGAEVNTK
jgi:hypothetical protein